MKIILIIFLTFIHRQWMLSLGQHSVRTCFLLAILLFSGNARKECSKWFSKCKSKHYCRLWTLPLLGKIYFLSWHAFLQGEQFHTPVFEVLTNSQWVVVRAGVPAAMVSSYPHGSNTLLKFHNLFAKSACNFNG